MPMECTFINHNLLLFLDVYLIWLSLTYLHVHQYRCLFWIQFDSSMSLHDVNFSSELRLIKKYTVETMHKLASSIYFDLDEHG